MRIIRWLRIQYYEPQYNKTISMIGHYKLQIQNYAQNTNDDRGIGRATYNHSVKALEVWEHKKEILGRKLEQARRS